jgi:hypothetical protein
MSEAGIDIFGNRPDGLYARTAFAATAGGLASGLTGGKFSNGAITAAFAHLFNSEKLRGIGDNSGKFVTRGLTAIAGDIGAIVGRWVLGPLGALVFSSTPLNQGEISGPTAWHEHHIFPQQFRSWFAAAGIDIDAYVVDVPNGMHLSAVHGSGGGYLPGGWNGVWRNFIEANPNATAQQIYQQAGKMMDDFELNDLPYMNTAGRHDEKRYPSI